MKISFLIPAYNEAATIGEVLRRVLELDLDKEVVVVDDGSTDETPKILAEAKRLHPELVVVRQRNRGKGAAVRTAIERATGEIAVIQDADAEYDPADVPALVRPIEDGLADVVFGSRLTGGRPRRMFLFWHLAGNRALSLLTNVLFNTTISDMETGYKAFRMDVLRGLRLRANDFAIEPEITAKVARGRYRIYEIPVSYYGRTYEEGKKITWVDGLLAIRTLLRIRLFGWVEDAGGWLRAVPVALAAARADARRLAALALLAAVAGAALWGLPGAFSSTFDAASGFDAYYASQADPATAREAAGATRLGIDWRVLAALRQAVPPDSTFAVVTGQGDTGMNPSSTSAAPSYLAYWLLPAREVQDPRQADWVISWGGTLEGVPLASHETLHQGIEIGKVIR